MSRKFEESSQEADDKVKREHLYECLGIEVFVTRGLARHIEETRRSHMDAVLSEQGRQNERGVYNAELLSSVSHKKTAWSKKRAETLAIGYSKILN